jgi:hypothetical protein
LTPPINKTMSREDLDCPDALPVVAGLNELISRLELPGLRPSTWYGWLAPDEGSQAWERANRGLQYAPLPAVADDERYPWFLYWEIVWLVLHNDFRPGERLLDLGGAGSLFSCYLASQGVEVTTLDLNKRLVAHGHRIAEATGWPLRNLVMDMARPRLDGPFDHITSVCVYEHLPVSGRVQASQALGSLLTSGGTFSATFDYMNPAPEAMISSPEAVREQFTLPSGFDVRGNERFHDTGQRYLLHPAYHPAAASHGWKLEPGDAAPAAPADGRYTFGALFLERA